MSFPKMLWAVLLAILALAGTSDAGEAFRFSVMGDNRPKGDSGDIITQPEEFRQAIREVNLIRPDMSIILGDLIMGYTQDEAEIGKMWAAFDDAIREFKVPIVEVAGNHDVWNPASAAIFKARNGYLYKSFDHKGCRFLVLDSEDQKHREQIAGEQLEWLKKELTRGEPDRIFVFLHKPFWRYAPGASNWNKEVHPLLAAAKVEAVFAGHWHYYERSTDRDGIRYYVTGGAGAEIGENAYAGQFFHHLIVDVPANEGQPSTVHLLRTGFLKEDVIVTESEVKAVDGLRESLVPKGIPVVEGQAADATVHVTARNPWDLPILVRYDLKPEEAGGWRMEPGTTELLVPARGECEVWLRFKAAADSLFPAPGVDITVTREGTRVLKTLEYLPVRFDRTLDIGKLAGVLNIDGVLDEPDWSGRKTAGQFLTTDGRGFAKLGTEFRVARDDEALYLSFRCEQPGAAELEGAIEKRDWMMLSEDCVIFYLDPVRDGTSRFCLGVTAGGVCMDYRAPGGAVDFAWNPEWGFAVRRDAEGWTLEVRIPFAILGVTPEAGMKIGVNAVRRSTAGDSEMSGWSIPAAGRLSNPAGFGKAVLR